MKLLYAAILSLTLLFTTGYARDLPELMPHLEVTGLVTGNNTLSMRSNVKNATIINDRIAYEGDIFEVKESFRTTLDVDNPYTESYLELGDKVVPGGRVKVGPNLLEIKHITKKGVIVLYSEKETSYSETKFIPIKKRK